jgi:hypothetical protein
MKTTNVLITAVATLALLSSGALAQNAASVRKACMADRQALCPGVAPGPALKQCMKSHKANISPGCHAAMEAAKAQRSARRAQMAPAASTSGTAAPAPIAH